MNRMKKEIVVDGVNVNVNIEYVISDVIYRHGRGSQYELSYDSCIILGNGNKELAIDIRSLENIAGQTTIDAPSDGNIEESLVINKLVKIYKVMDVLGVFNLGKVKVEIGKIFCDGYELFEVSVVDFSHNRIEELCTNVKLKLDYIKHTEYLEREERIKDIATWLSGYDVIINRRRERNEK